MHDNKYMYVNDIDIGFSGELPEKNQRLQFHLNNNRFKVVQWNQNVYLTINIITSNYSVIQFDASEEIVRWGKPLELFLKRC